MFIVNPKSKGKYLDLGKTSFKNIFLVLRWPYIQVLSNLVPRSSRIKVEKKDLNFGKLSRWTGQVRQTFSATTFDHYFQHNLLTVCLIDHILLPLAS
jgi:hypothetical protein